MTKISMRCRTCGSADVMRDAWAEWDDALQAWVLGAVFDAAFCATCEADTSIDEISLDASAESAPPAGG